MIIHKILPCKAGKVWVFLCSSSTSLGLYAIHSPHSNSMYKKILYFCFNFFSKESCVALFYSILNKEQEVENFFLSKFTEVCDFGFLGNNIGESPF